MNIFWQHTTFLKHTHKQQLHGMGCVAWLLRFQLLKSPDKLYDTLITHETAGIAQHPVFFFQPPLLSHRLQLLSIDILRVELSLCVDAIARTFRENRHFAAWTKMILHASRHHRGTDAHHFCRQG